jgi:glutaredoxin
VSFFGVCLQKDFVFCLERMWSSKRTTEPPAKESGNGWGVGVAIIIVLLLCFVAFAIWGTCTDSGKSTFANIKSKLPGLGSGSSDLRNLDIVMFMSPTCPWCKKMMGVLDEAGQLKNITVVDISKPEGTAMAQQFGADKQPVPSFISRKNKVGTVGYRDSVSKLIDALKMPAAPNMAGGMPGQPGPGSSEEPPMMPPGMPGQIDINFIKALQIVLFAREGCPWCTKAKESCSQAGVMDVIQVVDITTPEGQTLAGQVLPPGTSGVPAWVSLATKKHVVGFKPFDQLLQELQNGNVPNVMS